MISLSHFTSFDGVVALIFLIFILRGVWVGFMRQLATLLALVGSYWLAGRYSGLLLPYVGDITDNPKIIFLASCAILFLILAIVFILIAKVLRRVMEIALLGWFDRFLGFFLGGLKGALVAVFLYMMLVSSLSASNNILVKSFSAPYLSQGAVLVRQAIHDPRLRKLFMPREPAIKDEPLTKLKEKLLKKVTKEQ